jgi:4-alpha-glucanotransferase
VVQLPRSSGILIHPTSFPSKFGIGDFGPEAYRMVDQFYEARQTVWQMLPLGPPNQGNSPYSLYSAFAGNPLLISPELLLRDQLLTEKDLETCPHFPDEEVQYERVAEWKFGILRKAFEHFGHADRHPLQTQFEAFKSEEKGWLDEYALFMSLRTVFPRAGSWVEWDEDIALRQPEAVKRWTAQLADDIERESFWQFLFFHQWKSLREFCRQRQVRLMGDIPIYVSHDSADVWAKRENYELDEKGKATLVSGVPPDYFSETGQLWGNPIYNWSHMQQDNFSWWIARFRKTHESFDIIRLDHFRGFAAYWAVPATETTAVNGSWIKAPGAELFTALQQALGTIDIVAENLGLITPDVEELRSQFNFPGMAVLQFGFTPSEGSGSAFQPHNYERNLVAYTGTHDNDTTVAWWREFGADAPPEQVAKQRAAILRYFGIANEKDLIWTMMRTLSASVAQFAIVPMQDILELGTESRMNTPGSGERNWRWRMKPGAFTPDLLDRLRDYAELYERIQKS